MNKVTEFLKRHVYCIIIIAVTILISGSVIAYKTQDDALSITASIVSIVLAVVVIMYTFYHSERSSRMTEQSERNMRETKEAVSEILHKTANAEAMLNQMQSQTITKEKVVFKADEDSDFERLYTSIAVESREKEVMTALESKTDDEKINYLIRAYVNIEYGLLFEKTYGVVFGSQILFLEKLEQSVPVGINDDVAKSNYYHAAVDENPGFYETYSYENYMSFLESGLFIIKEGNVWKITNVGLDFMGYLRTSNILALARERQG